MLIRQIVVIFFIYNASKNQLKKFDINKSLISYYKINKFMKITTFRTIKLITMLLLLSMIGCSSVINKKKFHNSDYTRKRVNGIYKYYTRYDK